MTQALLDAIGDLPKVLLHDHLDGGLRPQTVLELADAVGHELPANDADALATWFRDAADSGSLPRYLETFDHTIAVMQTPEALARAAREAVLDLAADGVVYAEQRWAPEQHLQRGMSLPDTVEAVQHGIDEGVREAAEQGRTIRVGQLVTAMRHTDRWVEIAELAVAYRDAGVVGFDIAGPEDGFAPDRHAEVWRFLAEQNFPTTIHAGEAAGLESISQAVHLGQADRLGHGVRIMEDIVFSEHDRSATLGRLAHWVRDHQIALEVCPVSNLQTAAAPGVTTVADHPITRLKELDFAVTLNTDNRLMSRTSMSHEMRLLVSEAGWTIDDLADVTMTAAWSAFIHHDERRALVDDLILPGYQKIEGALR
ncbi:MULTISPECIES: adenosine deaminase [unclassified Isoptericola]|uniref:adenosine deaminase n=1 Tax=unclassified Isoptericola TaxID=2623355 RepID=UPI0027140B6B|nr:MULTISPECIES: adenosine deaminase [unclassified Isoptericola]MDO8144349.1 adenosine deaminase [Isoptericola sp. 178]MDO8148203.1 adenosine deaminase [Isoptericola sp. b515]MDO8151680.1 adenosine deaminase [Isoptericola sp. b408]